MAGSGFLAYLKVLACNMEKQMCRILIKNYEKKAAHPMLSIIAERAGDIKLEDGRLRLRLKRFSGPETMRRIERNEP